MQETLLTLRGIHRLSIAGCVTVLLLAMTPGLAHRYQSALDELQQAEADFAEFNETGIEISGPAEEDDDIAALIRDVIVNDLKGDGGLVTTWSFHEDIEDNVLPRLDSSRELMKRLDQPLDQMSLAAIVEFSSDPAWHDPVQIMIPDATELRQKLLALLVERIPKRFEQLSTDSTPHKVKIRVRFPQLDGNDDPYRSAGFFVECGLDEEEPWLLGFDMVAASSRQLTEVPAAYQVRKELPHCGRVWAEVHGMTVTDAMQLLKSRKADTTADVTLMGFRIPKHVALLLGPLVTAILFLYLQLHVKHAIPRMQRHGWQAEDFPWIAFYLDRASKLVTVFTLVYLPLASCGLLTYSEWTLTGQFPWLIAGCTMFCTFSGITTLARIRSIPADCELAGQEPEAQTLKLAA